MKNYKLKSGKITNRKELLLILDWCKKKLGRSKYYSIKKIKFRINTKINYMGFFSIDNNVIYVNPNVHDNFVDLIETIIHEYVHFKQNPREYERLWRKNLFMKYFEHPHEEEAERIAQSLGKICYSELRKKKLL